MSKSAAGSAARSDVRRTSAAALWTATTIMAAVIISRRMGGHFDDALHPALATLVTAVLSAMNLSAALLANTALATGTDFAQKRRVPSAAISLLTAVTPMAVGFALLPSDAILGLSLVFTVAVLSGLIVLVAGSDGLRPPRVTASETQSSASIEPVVEPQPRSTEVAGFSDESELEMEEPIDQESLAISQSMSRSTGTDGSETIEGTVLLSFASGQQIGVVHLPFSPQLASEPQVSCHLLEDRPVRLRVTTAQSYGVRLEAKRTDAALDEVDIQVGYIITADNTQANAA